MVEHVGAAQIDRYAATLGELVRPGGTILNHGIAVTDPTDDPLDDAISMRYVFPDGEPLPYSRVQLAFERAGLHVEHVEGFQSDYAETLRRWHERLDERLPEAERLAGPRAHPHLAPVPARGPPRLRRGVYEGLPGPGAPTGGARPAGRRPPRRDPRARLGHPQRDPERASEQLGLAARRPARHGDLSVGDELQRHRVPARGCTRTSRTI